MNSGRLGMYDIRQDEDGYSVIDTDTGRVARVDGVAMRGLDLLDADELAEMLNHVASRPGRLAHAAEAMAALAAGEVPEPSSATAPARRAEAAS
ncbi:MAG TPA: hypothetical protein VEY95_05110 [Azospirillaceae bacterium]|nr:hypothetical protein [Azospirillaceae bacterium]